MSRIVGLDIGEKRIGIAVSDELLITAQPYGVLEIDSGKDVKQEIKKIVETYNPSELVIGLPKNMNGELGEQANKIIALADELKEILDVTIKLWDERLTTVSANKILIDGNMSRKKRKTKVDSIAASLMLQSYLDTKERNV